MYSLENVCSSGRRTPTRHGMLRAREGMTRSAEGDMWNSTQFVHLLSDTRSHGGLGLIARLVNAAIDTCILYYSAKRSTDLQTHEARAIAPIFADGTPNGR